MYKAFFTLFIFATLIFAATDSLIIQPGPGQAQDCQIVFDRDLSTGGSWGNYNNGSVPCFSAGAYDWNTVCRSLIKFNMPQNINPDSIISAKMVLYSHHYVDQNIDTLYPIEIHEMLRDWNAGTGSGECADKVPNSDLIDGATGFDRFWGNQDGTEKWNTPHVGLDDIDARSIAETSASSMYNDSIWTFDITDLCKGWISDTAQNYGVLIRSPFEHGINDMTVSYPVFWTGDNTTDITKRPKLVLTYKSERRLIANWSFDSVSQGNFYDITGNGYDAVSTGLGVTEGVSGTALDCNEPAFDIVVNNSIGNFELEHFTIEGWIYPYVDMINPGSFYNYKQIFDYARCGLEGSGDAGGFSLHITDLGKLQFSMANPTRIESWTSIQADSILQPRSWYYVSATYDGSVIKLFINGKLVKEKEYFLGFLPSNIDARIGCQYQVTSGTDGRMRNWFNGKIDELKLYNYALDQQTITSHYNDLKPETEPAYEINLGMKTTYAQPGDTISMPVLITNFEDFSISACQFAINFDTSKLELINVSKDSGLIKEWPLFDWVSSGTSTTIAMGGIETPINYGEGELLRCRFLIKHSTSKGDTCTISLQDIIIDESFNLVKATSKEGRIIINNAAIVYGDVTGNNDVNIFDAQRVLAYVVGSLSIPNDCCPNFTIAVADVSGNGSITSYDAALIFQHSVGLLPEFPVERTSVLSKTTSTSGSAVLEMKIENQGTEEISYKLMGSNLKGFLAGEFSIQYDPAIINLSNGSITTAVRGATLNSKLDSEEMLLKIALVTNDDIDNNEPVTLATITLPPDAGSSPSAFSIMTALINEGKILTNIGYQTFSQYRSPGAKTVPYLKVSGRNLIINHSGTEVAELRIWSLDGRCIERKIINSKNAALKVNFAKGIYLYQIKAGSKFSTGRFIISY